MEGVSGFSDWNANAATSKNRWNDPIVPATQAGCVAPDFLWDTKDNKCIDKRVYYEADGTTVIYDGSNKKTYDREEQVWDSFVRHFQLSRNTTDECSDPYDDCGWWVGDIKQPFADNDSGYRDKALYFSPNCEGLELGGTGGTITFLRARVPVLVY
jgi:hypothetical protein